MSPHTGKGNRHRHTDKQWKEGGIEWENCLDDDPPLLTTLQVYAQSTRKNASNEEHMELQRMRKCKKKNRWLLENADALWC